MEGRKAELLERIQSDREVLLGFFRRFIRCRSPNPPGDTREAAGHIRQFLAQHGADFRVIAPSEIMPNIVATFEGGKPGRHLALNGHIDVFPVGDGAGWTHDPWGAEVVDGRIYGRGACDMKCGTTAAIFTFLYLRELRAELHGRLTLSAVSDEETFGPYGARYLSEHHPEVFGDSCLSGEPSSPWTLRFGEKGPLWLEFTVRTKGAHGAYTHASKSATAIAAKIIGELEILEDIPAPEAGNLAAALDEAAPAIDRAQGEGAAGITRGVTVNQASCAADSRSIWSRRSVPLKWTSVCRTGSTRRRSLPRSTESSRPIPKPRTDRSSTTRRAGARPTPSWRNWCAPMPRKSPVSIRPR